VRFLGRQYSLDGRKWLIFLDSRKAPDLFGGFFSESDAALARNSQISLLPGLKKEGFMMSENNTIHSNDKNRARVHWIAKTGILTAVAAVLMFLEMNLPLMPAFLKFDFSEIAVLLATFTMGPLTGILVELLKNLIHYPFTMTNGVGELANFMVGASFVGTAGIIYRLKKTRTGAVISMVAATVAMTLAACLVNYFITLPFYFQFIPLEQIIMACQAVGNRLVTDIRTLLLYVFVPFNLFKGLVISLIVSLIYKRISPLLHR